MASLRFQITILLLLGAIGFLQYRLWFESGGVNDLWRLKASLGQQLTVNSSLKQTNEALQQQIQRLQHNEEETEARARNELGMIKKDETFYQIIAKDNA